MKLRVYIPSISASEMSLFILVIGSSVVVFLLLTFKAASTVFNSVIVTLSESAGLWGSEKIKYGSRKLVSNRMDWFFYLSN